MEKFNFIPVKKFQGLPKSSGVYCFKDKNKIIYIGKANNLRERVKNHFSELSYKDYLFLKKVKKVGWISTNSEIEALILEANLIKKYRPKYNVIWKDSKNYFYVAITKEDFPRIFITHQPQKIRSTKHEIRNKSQIPNFKFQKKVSDFGFRISDFEVVGPFVDGKALKQTLKILRKVFPFRSCKKIPNRPCLWYHLGYCLAPCLLKSKFIKEIPPDSMKIKKISQKNAQRIMGILKEGKVPVLRELKKEMKILAKKQEFEEAAKTRDQIEALEKVMRHAKIFEMKKEIKEWLEIEEKLKEILKTKRKISRIEAYDISQIHGNFAVGSMITFLDGFPEKNLYRKFKIKFTKIPSDVDMIKEVLERRLKHKEWGFPDVILIDGGRAQLNAAVNCKLQIVDCKWLKVIALAKKENKLYIENQKEPILSKNLPREISNLILKLRDEAHRFAITYHKKLREKELIKK